jgi:TatD DNase family protein
VCSRSAIGDRECFCVCLGAKIILVPWCLPAAAAAAAVHGTAWQTAALAAAMTTTTAKSRFRSNVSALYLSAMSSGVESRRGHSTLRFCDIGAKYEPSRSTSIWVCMAVAHPWIPFSCCVSWNELHEIRFVLVVANARHAFLACSLLDERFLKGVYRGTHRHEPDINAVIERARANGVQRIILTAGTVAESRAAIQQARLWNTRYNKDEPNGNASPIHFTCTVGVHPTRCSQVFEGAVAEPSEKETATERRIVDADALLEELYEICCDGMTDQTVVAVGEIGLDYDRLDFCPADIQQTYLIRQLQVLAQRTGLPLFLHNRSVGSDLYDILKRHGDCWKRGGVVHSFDDSLELANKFIDMGFYIGLNGCSLRTEQNLQVVAQLPLERILLETE